MSSFRKQESEYNFKSVTQLLLLLLLLFTSIKNLYFLELVIVS